MVQPLSQGSGPRLAPSLTASRYQELQALRDILSEGKELPLAPTIAIGDIHGNSHRLLQILTDPIAKSARHTVFLGDYFDRDAFGIEVFEMLRSLSPEKHTFLLGNHEIYFLHAIAGDPEHFALWLANGGIRLFDNVVDTGELRSAVQKTIPTIDQPNMLQIISAIRAEDPGLLDRYHVMMQQQPIMHEIRQWLLDYGRLFAFDISGILFVHAGLSPLQIPHLGIFDTLLKFEQRWKATFHEKGPRALGSALSFATAFEHLLETRDTEWLEDFAGLDAPGVASQLARMGIRAIVYGHTPMEEIRSPYQRFFNIDFRMARSYGSFGGMLSIGPQGIKAHRFEDAHAAQMQETILVSREDFRAMTVQDTSTLIASFEHFFNTAHLNVSAKAALSTSTFTAPLPLLRY